MFLATVVTRWTDFAAMVALVGGLILEIHVLPRDPPTLDGARRRLRRLSLICVVALLVTSAAELVTRTQTMAGGALAAALPAIPSVLARTHFGMIWAARLGALLLALLIARVEARWVRIVSLLLALAVTVTTSLTGHAADWGDVTATAAIDWVHVLSVSVWTGGLLGLTLCVLGTAREWPAPVFETVARRFSRLAGVCLVAAALTGSYNAWSQVRAVSALWTTVYGRVLLAKIVLFIAVAWLGAVSRYTIVARLGAARVAALGPSRLRAYVAREAALAFLVLGMTAVLVDSTPARHAGHGGHQAMHEPEPPGMTMDELSERGGVPRVGGTTTRP